MVSPFWNFDLGYLWVSQNVFIYTLLYSHLHSNGQ